MIYIYNGKYVLVVIEKNPIKKDALFALDYGKFTPYLCKAIQEHIIEKNYNNLLLRIEELEKLT